MGESLMGRLAKKLISQVTEPVKIEVCRGSLFGCPKGVVEPKDLEMEILDMIDQMGLTDELKDHLPDESVFQPTLRISISGCVNGCSRPYIKDIGLEGIVELKKDHDKCTLCGKCMKVCQENAIFLEKGTFRINSDKCLHCGECARVCPSKALTISKSGVSLLVGGRLGGRHPQIGETVATFLTPDDAMKRIREILKIVMAEHKSGHRVVEALTRLKDKQELLTSTGQ